MDKKIILIYVSHRNLKENPNLNDACKVLDEEKNRLNADELHEELEIKLIDYQYWRNISNPNKSPFQSRNTNKKKALHTHAHFTLVDGDMSPEIRKWYFRTIKWVRNSILMPIFWNTANSASRENCKKFEEKHKNKIDYIIEYNSLDELRKEAHKKMKELRSRCISKIDRRRKVPTILSVIVKKIIRWVIILLIAVLIWKKSGSIHSLLFPDKKPVVPEIELIDSSRLSFNDRIAYAESLVAQKQYTPALDTLMILKEICKIEWADEKQRINHIISIIPTDFTHPQKSVSTTKPEKDNTLQNNKTNQIRYLENGYSISGVDENFETLICHQIESSSDLRQYPGKEVQWSVQLSEIRNERGVDDGDFFVDFSVTVSIVNNKTGQALQKLPLFENKFIKSAISYDVAFKEAASEDFAIQIANNIVKSINNEK